MAKLRSVVFCERAIIDSASNNVSLINVLDEIHPDIRAVKPPTAAVPKNAVPIVPIPCALVSVWNRSDAADPEGKQPVRIRLLAPRNRKVAEVVHDLDLSKHTRGRLVANLPGIPFAGDGVYRWRVDVRTAKGRWRTVGGIDFLMSALDKAGREKAEAAARRSAARIASSARNVH